MRLVMPKLSISAKHFLRTCGYIEIQNPHKNNEISYARSIHPGRFYPRFHIYIETGNDQIFINIHLDAKQPSYEGAAAHSGEYDSPIVAEEIERIKINSNKFIPSADKKLSQPIGFKPQKSWWRKIFFPRS